MRLMEAATKMVAEFNRIQTSMIQKLMDYEPDAWQEVTPITGECPEEFGCLPMNWMMWSFNDPVDTLWLEKCDGLRKMAECGFRVYKNDEFGYFFGIDGCGYSFYEAHWIPLYKARGLRWHDED